VSGSRLISVQSNVVQETIVRRICERVNGRLPGAVPGPLSSVLTAPMAQAGYLARVVESELFEPARSPLPGLADDLCARLETRTSWPAAAAEFARELAAREPFERPDPNDPDAVSWKVPGPGGHVRHYVAQRLIQGRRMEGDPAALKRDFIYGFLVRCCEEALEDGRSR
jgi:hypothetical protein